MINQTEASGVVANRITPGYHHFHHSREDKHRNYMVHGVKYLQTISLEKCYSKQNLIGMKNLVKRVFKKVKVVRKIRLVQRCLTAEINKCLLNKLHTPIYHKYNQMLKSFKAIADIPKYQHFKALQHINKYWNCTFADLPSHLRQLKTLEIITG